MTTDARRRVDWDEAERILAKTERVWLERLDREEQEAEEKFLAWWEDFYGDDGR